MTDLTKKWKKSELEDGFYYLLVNGKFEIGICNDHYMLTVTDEEDVKVLREVPTLEELQRLESDSLAKNEGVEIVAELKEENARQKELIKKLGDDIELLEIKKSILIAEYNELHQLLKERHNQLSKFLVDGEEPKDEKIINLLTKIEECCYEIHI